VSENVRERIVPVFVDVADGDLTYQQATDRIIAIVREALLSEAAVEAGVRSLWSSDRMANSQRSSYAAAIEEHLAAAGFAEKEQGSDG